MNKLSAFFAVNLFLFSSFAIFSAESKSSIDRLLEGNRRYVDSQTVCHEDWSVKRTNHANNQAPFAVIITCSDSRVPPEIIFDQSLGDLFVIRVAGNVVDDFAIGSIEYGVSVLKADTVIVLGHSNCGAVDAALKGMKFQNHIQEVLNAIHPSLSDQPGNQSSHPPLEKAIKNNVDFVVKSLQTSKPVLAALFNERKLKIVGAYYDLQSGKVDFLNNNSKM